jgi:hypothetical protein
LQSKSTAEHCPGGKVLLPLPPGVRGDAVLGGTNREYRYELSRTWDDALPTLLFVMMNPSTALPWFDDPTVAKCRRYAIVWGFGTLLVGNTFAYRATAQERLMEVADPVGPDNDAHLLSMADRAAMIVFAYGQPRNKTLRYRGIEVARLLSRQGTRPLHYLRLAKNGTPCHPLYLPGSLKPVLWNSFEVATDGEMTGIQWTDHIGPKCSRPRTRLL